MNEEQQNTKPGPVAGPKWGTIEQKDPDGNIINTKPGIVCGRGDNKKTIDPDFVFELAALHCTFKEIACIVGINVETLKYNFGDYMEKGKAETQMRLRKAQLQNAYNGNTSMQIWLGKNILGQTDAPTNGANDEPLPWLD